VFLESRFDRCFDFLYFPNLILNQCTRLFVEQSYARAGACRISG